MVLLVGDFSPITLAQYLALIRMSCVIILQNESHKLGLETVLKSSKIKWIVERSGNKSIISASNYHYDAQCGIVQALQKKQAAGLVLFSSGTSGIPRGVIHEFEPFLSKFSIPNLKKNSFLAFMLFDHIGGQYQLFSSLFSGSTLAILNDRSPKTICATLSKYQIEFFPTNQSFLRVLLASGEWRHHDVSHVKVINYGTEPMSRETLVRIGEVFPSAKLHQNYGSSELGLLRSKSKSNDSLWMKFEGNDQEIRIQDGNLEVRRSGAFLGYLNEPSPFLEDGWFRTGDLAEEKDGWIKIIGRKKDEINVGGLKVHPTEVEEILLQMPNVVDVTVTGEPNLLLGTVIKAVFQLSEPENAMQFRARTRLFCKNRMDNFKIPARIEISQEPLYGLRWKKYRFAHDLAP